MNAVSLYKQAKYEVVNELANVVQDIYSMCTQLLLEKIRLHKFLGGKGLDG